MKKIRLIIGLVALFAFAGMGLSACGGDHSHDAEKSGPEYTSEYVCPMHCEGSGSDQPGKCPVCGMEYVKNEHHKADGHDHGTDHQEDGHDHDHQHGDGDGHDHDHQH